MSGSHDATAQLTKEKTTNGKKRELPISIVLETTTPTSKKSKRNGPNPNKGNKYTDAAKLPVLNLIAKYPVMNPALAKSPQYYGDLSVARADFIMQVRKDNPTCQQTDEKLATACFKCQIENLRKRVKNSSIEDVRKELTGHKAKPRKELSKAVLPTHEVRTFIIDYAQEHPDGMAVFDKLIEKIQPNMIAGDDTDVCITWS